jgi:transposase-like protein
MTAVCASCGKSFDELRYQVVIRGIHGPFDSIDCAEREWRRQLSRQRLITTLGEEQAARLFGETVVPAPERRESRPEPPAVALA